MEQHTEDVLAIIDDLTKAMLPVLQKHADKGEAVFLAMPLIHMRVIQSYVDESDWDMAAAQAAMALVKAMRLRFTDDQSN